MKKIVVFLILSCVGYAAHAYQCETGYYLADGKCAKCNATSLYDRKYCPGDDVAYDCPVADVSRATTCIEYAQLSYAFAAAGYESDCVGTRDCTDVGGRFYYECRWNGKDYSSCGADGAYWRRADTGYYLYGWRRSEGDIHSYTGVKACTNKPANSHYTGPGTPDEPKSGGKTDYNDCPWECDSGYGRHGNVCTTLCTAGFTQLKTSSGVTVNVYADKPSTPALNISTSRGTCYVTLAAGAANNAINVNYNGNTYHTVD